MLILNKREQSIFLHDFRFPSRSCLRDGQRVKLFHAIALLLAPGFGEVASRKTVIGSFSLDLQALVRRARTFAIFVGSPVVKSFRPRALHCREMQRLQARSISLSVLPGFRVLRRERSKQHHGSLILFLHHRATRVLPAARKVISLSPRYMSFKPCSRHYANTYLVIHTPRCILTRQARGSVTGLGVFAVYTRELAHSLEMTKANDCHFTDVMSHGFLRVPSYD